MVFNEDIPVFYYPNISIMIQTIVTPQKTNFDMSVSLPYNYIGKEVRVLFYIDEEVKQITASVLPKKKPSDFFGTLSMEDGENMKKYVNDSRNEWERNI